MAEERICFSPFTSIPIITCSCQVPWEWSYLLLPHYFLFDLDSCSQYKEMKQPQEKTHLFPPWRTCSQQHSSLSPTPLPLSTTSDWMVASTSTYLTCNKLQSIVRIATSQNSCMPHRGTCKIRGAESVVKLYGIYLILRDDRRKAGLFLFSRNMTFQLREWTKYGEEKPKARKENEIGESIILL